MRALFERFWTVDDPYVVQRVVAIAYGALLRSTPGQADQAKALARAVHARVFARPYGRTNCCLTPHEASPGGQ